ncbi:MAG: hypothetical protein LH478_05845 [Chitinophagaceae bacterium]|nr:hypothetical protein [Chitinophagaceae bacterium]
MSKAYFQRFRIYKLHAILALFTFIASLNANTGRAQKIPIDTARWYQQNYTVGNLARLFDGNPYSVAFTGWSKILTNYDAYYPLVNGESMTIDSIRMYDKEGVFTSTPLRLYAITDTWQKKLIATFTGETYNTWVGPYPARPAVIKLDTTVTNIRYLVLNIYNNDFPGEIELYGSYTAGDTSTAYTKTHVPLKNMFGINGFEWDFEDAVRPRSINETKMTAMKSFRGLRHYMDWEKLEEVEGRYMFNPVARGGWNYDAIYKRCKQEGIEVVACLKTLPPWMINTYPQNQREWDNNPVRYGSDFTNPSSYLEMARVAFQHVARYGSNTNIDTSLVSVYSIPKWFMDPVNERKIGLGLIKYIECDNERDKWWKGRKGYLTGREYAANLSAFYDGHKNTMGPGIGVKNADYTIQVVMAGTASTSPDYLKGMIDWCKEFRGYNVDSTVNLCWDVVNFHLYSNDEGSSQSGNSTRGSAPEKSNCATVARQFLQVSHQYSNNMPVWITELGYDINQGSPLKAIAIGNRSALQTQADWDLRSSLLYSREGLQKAFFYEVYDANINAPYKFASSGFINADTTRKPAADFLFQANKLFGEYTFTQTLNGDPFVDRYEFNGQKMYALVVPDEIGRTANYTLDLGTAGSAVIYTPQAGSNDMIEKVVSTANGKLTIVVTETPVFVVPLELSFSKNSMVQ